MRLVIGKWDFMVELFKSDPKYSEWGADGLPTKLADGSELPKKAMKNLKKQYDRQAKLHEKVGNTPGLHPIPFLFLLSYSYLVRSLCIVQCLHSQPDWRARRTGLGPQSQGCNILGEQVTRLLKQ